jgi:hypothetical protein
MLRYGLALPQSYHTASLYSCGRTLQAKDAMISQEKLLRSRNE